MAKAPDGFGYIKISRKLYDTDPFWNEPREFSRHEAWEDLIQSAAWRGHGRVIGGDVVELERGEILASLRFLSARWQWGVKKVRGFLSLLEKTDRVRAQRETQHGTVYLLVNYGLYQGGGTVEDTPEDDERAHRGHTEGTPRAQREGSKAGKEGEANTTTIRTTAAAVGSFCERLGVQWKLKDGIAAWAASLEREPLYAGIDLPYEIRSCAEWHEAKGKKPKAPDRAIRNWLERSAERVREKRPATDSRGLPSPFHVNPGDLPYPHHA